MINSSHLLTIPHNNMVQYLKKIKEIWSSNKYIMIKDMEINMQ